MTKIIQSKKKHIDKELLKQFDEFSVILLGIGLLLSIFQTKLAIYHMSFLLPATLLIRKLFVRGKFSDFIESIKENKLLLAHAFIFSLIPIVFGYFRGDYFYEDHRAHWLNAESAYLIPLFYLSTLYAISLCKSLFRKVYKIRIGLCLLLFSSFFLDFVYAIYLSIYEGSARWEGSANNPNTWAIQASIILLLLVISHQDFQRTRVLKIIHGLLALTAITAIYYSASFNNILALVAAAVSLVLSSYGSLLIAFLILLLIFTVAFNLFLLFGLNINDFTAILDPAKESFIPVKKFLPRLRLWQDASDFLHTSDYSLWFGAGYDKYRSWVLSLDNKNQDHIHNSFLHWTFLYGIPGLYSAFAYLFFLKHNLFREITELFTKALKQLSKNLSQGLNKFKLDSKAITDLSNSSKYYLAIITYVLVVASFDCSFFFYESQVLFWITIPIINFVLESTD